MLDALFEKLNLKRDQKTLAELVDEAVSVPDSGLLVRLLRKGVKLNSSNLNKIDSFLKNAMDSERESGLLKFIAYLINNPSVKEGADPLIDPLGYDFLISRGKDLAKKLNRVEELERIESGEKNQGSH
jgi:hypothetical protein